jgi:thioredoxin reductase
MTQMHTKIVVIGAGPAGLQLAFFLKKFDLEHIVLERDDVASFFCKFPRHRRLISINKPNTGIDDPQTNLRWDWHSLLDDDITQRFSRHCVDYYPLADDYVKYLNNFAIRNNVEVIKGANVTTISRPDHKFCIVRADGNEHTADIVVVATGLSRERKLDFAGAEYIETYADVSIDPASFMYQRVLILGKGNAAFETANNLITTAAAVHLISPSPTNLASRSGYAGAVRGFSAAFQDTHWLRSQNTVIDATVQRIERVGAHLSAYFVYTEAPSEVGRLTIDRVISCAGFAVDTTIFGMNCRPDLCHGDRYPVMTSAWESASVPNMYFAGNLMHARDFKRASSGFVHGFRFNILALAKILRNRLTNRDWGSYEMPLSAEDLSEFILHRADTAAALFNQPTIFSDIIVVELDLHRCKVYEDTPLDYFRDFRAGKSMYYALTLEFAAHERATEKQPSSGRSIIHPVIRRTINGQCVSEYHFPEDLDTKWHKVDYATALREWLDADLAAMGCLRGAAHHGQERLHSPRQK